MISSEWHGAGRAGRYCGHRFDPDKVREQVETVRAELLEKSAKLREEGTPRLPETTICRSCGATVYQTAKICDHCWKLLD